MHTKVWLDILTLKYYLPGTHARNKKAESHQSHANFSTPCSRRRVCRPPAHQEARSRGRPGGRGIPRAHRGAYPSPIRKARAQCPCRVGGVPPQCLSVGVSQVESGIQEPNINTKKRSEREKAPPTLSPPPNPFPMRRPRH